MNTIKKHWVIALIAVVVAYYLWTQLSGSSSASTLTSDSSSS